MSTDTASPERAAVVTGDCECGRTCQRTLPMDQAATGHYVLVRCRACGATTRLRIDGGEGQARDPAWVVAAPDCRFGEVAVDV